jgi:hypothetical protein
MTNTEDKAVWMFNLPSIHRGLIASGTFPGIYVECPVNGSSLKQEPDWENEWIGVYVNEEGKQYLPQLWKIIDNSSNKPYSSLIRIDL